MAIAGKVAITLSTENGGAWSADVTYDRLVAVKHNNNLYISRRTVTNIEPPNDEFWFLALEGFGGDDVQALIDSLNELSNLIQEIINGTTQVGNAKTLDGNSADAFAKAVDLANYLQKSGGTVANSSIKPLEIEKTSGITNVYTLYSGNENGEKQPLGYLGFRAKDIPTYLPSTGTGTKDLIHTGNKPTGTYTGNGDATQRTVDTNGIGRCLLVNSSIYYAFVTPLGAIYSRYDGNNGVLVLPASEAKYGNGILTLATASNVFNQDGTTYNYQVI